MKLLICAGGTGGGVYPALTVLDALTQLVDPTGQPEPNSPVEEDQPGDSKAQSLEMMWVGTTGGMEAELVRRKAIPFTTIPAAGIHGVGWRSLPGNLVRLIKGFSASRKILKEFNPDIILFTGGYVAVPMAAAGRGFIGKRIPSALFIPDIEPGLALKTLTRVADVIAVTTEESRKYLPARSKVYITGYPTRPGLARWNKQDAQKYFNLSVERPTVCVLGGSTGARSINRAIINNLPELLAKVQVIHLSGQRDWEEVNAAQSRLTPELAAYYHAFPYLHEEIGAAFRAADLVVSRAGASCLGEYPLFGLPAILVPYPHAWRYQQVNATYLAKSHAAIIVNDQDLGNILIPTILEIISNKKRLEDMHSAMLKLANPEAANTIAQLIYGLASVKWSNS